MDTELSPAIPYLRSLVLLFGISALVVFFLGKVKMPSIVGFLVTGLLIGPSGFDLVKNTGIIESLAEIGVVLLMFAIGLEFSLRNLMALKRLVFGAGVLQVCLTAGITALFSYAYLARGVNSAIFNGFLVALSSTAIVLKMLLDRAEIHTSYGRSSVGMLIFQDLCVVPFMLLVPVLAGTGGGNILSVLFTIGKAAFIIAAVLLASQWAVPYLLHQVVNTRSRELFIITIVVLCEGTALLTSTFGLSLALGAFLAGVVISGSDYSSQAVSDILPFKESFTGLFFVSIGMLLNLGVFATHFWTIVLVVLFIIAVKTLATGVAAYLVGQTLAAGLRSGFNLSQIGEFSFVLAMVGVSHGLMDDGLYQVFLSASVITMMMTPLLIRISSPVSMWLSSKSVLHYLDGGRRQEKDYGKSAAGLEDHVVIIGFGVNGSNIARVLKDSEVPYTVVESNSSLVRKARREGEPIHYGDASSVGILHRVRLGAARILVVVISDPGMTRRIVQIARQENPRLHIIVRTRLVAEVDHLLALGADEVVPEEFETSVEIFSKVLHYYHVPANIIRDRIDAVRLRGYLAFRTLDLPKKFLADRPELLKNVQVETYLVKEGSEAIGRTLKDLNLRAATGATIIGVEREEVIHRMPPPTFRLASGDVLFLVGSREHVHSAVDFLDGLARNE